jgi:beta-lactam-binding protein with PASTA domain
VIALAAVTAIAVIAPAAAGARTGGTAAASPASMVYTAPEQCEVLPVVNKPFPKARALLAELGCRVHRTLRASTLRRGLVVSIVGGTRSYGFGHTVTLIVSSGPAGAT